jgi:predicted nucleic acid-binding protein
VPTQIFVDTLFIIALINQRDQYHQQALALADTLEGQPLLTTDAVLLEIGNALARNFKAEAVEVLDDLLSSEEIEVVRLTPELFGEAYELYRRYQDKAWGLVDCISFVVMRRAQVHSALTFDQHFPQAGFQALMREEPPR